MSEDRRFTSWLSNIFIPVICVTVSPGCPGDSTIAPVFWFKPEYCNVAPIMESIRLPRNPDMPPEKEGCKCKLYLKWEILFKPNTKFYRIYSFFEMNALPTTIK